jgi:hypothetical protein
MITEVAKTFSTTFPLTVLLYLLSTASWAGARKIYQMANGDTREFGNRILHPFPQKFRFVTVVIGEIFLVSIMLLLFVGIFEAESFAAFILSSVLAIVVACGILSLYIGLRHRQRVMNV